MQIAVTVLSNGANKELDFTVKVSIASNALSIITALMEFVSIRPSIIT